MDVADFNLHYCRQVPALAPLFLNICPTTLMMPQFLHISRSLDKQLAELRRTGKKAELAAAKCESILADIQRFGCQAEAVAGKRTRHGEQRIRNCVKYDLGGGYRLITIRVNCHLLVPFAGTHDEADQWLEHHRYDDFAPDGSAFRCAEIGPSTPASPVGPGFDQNVHGSDAYEEELQGRLDENSLKAVFQGLFMVPPVTASKSAPGRHGG